MPLDIPQEQLERIQPIVSELSSALLSLTAALPFDAQSAIVFSPAGGDRA